MTAELAVLQHDPETPPSAFVEVLDARAHLAPWRLVDVAAGDPLPPVEDLAGIVALGGRPRVPDADEHPWMAGESDLLRRAVEAGVPVLGVCLGGQLLASALDGAVERRDVPEVGYRPLRRTEAAGEEPVAAGWPDGTSALFFHADEITRPPEGAQQTLEGADGPAAWRLGSAVAVQFHPEITVERLSGWVEHSTLRARLHEAGVDVPALLEEAGRRERYTVAQGRALLGRFIDDPVRKHLADRDA